MAYVDQCFIGGNEEQGLRVGFKRVSDGVIVKDSALYGDY